MSRTHFAVAAAAFRGASDHAAGKGVSSSGAGAIKWCCCQCISATGAVGAAGVGTDVVLHTAMQNDTRKWSWSIRTKRYRFLTLYRFTTLRNYAAYTPGYLKLIVLQHTCKLPSLLHTEFLHIKDSV